MMKCKCVNIYRIFGRCIYWFCSNKWIHCNAYCLQQQLFPERQWAPSRVYPSLHSALQSVLWQSLREKQWNNGGDDSGEHGPIKPTPETYSRKKSLFTLLIWTSQEIMQSKYKGERVFYTRWLIEKMERWWSRWPEHGTQRWSST